MKFLIAPRLAVVVVGLAASPWLAAQTSQAPVLKSSQVTEDALENALAIDTPAADEATGTTRGFRPSVRATGSTFKPGKPAGPGKANLLITFATGSAELTPETIQVLQTVAKALQGDKLAGFAFRIEGHADPRGTEEYNLKLSQERADSVVAYLTTKLGVLPERLQAVGKGSAELLNPDHPDAVENRRVTIVTTQ